MRFTANSVMFEQRKPQNESGDDENGDDEDEDLRRFADVTHFCTQIYPDLSGLTELIGAAN